MRFIENELAPTEEKEINIDRKPLVEQDKILEGANYRKINHAHLENPAFTKNDDLEKYIFEINPSYNYIYNIKISEKSKEGLDKLNLLIKTTKAELKKISEATWQKLWIEELKELNEVVYKGIQTNWNFDKPHVTFKSSGETQKGKAKGKGKGKEKLISVSQYARLELPDETI